MQNQTRVFISYRRKDSAQIDQLVEALKAEGIDPWLDRNEIEDAASIQARIDSGLAESHALLAWYSKDYPQSRACQWELTAALIAGSAETAPQKRLFVVNPEETSDHIQPVQVRDLQHFTFNGDYADLARRIKAELEPITGTLGALRQLVRPDWHGYHGLGSNRFVGRVPDLWNIHSALAAGNFAIVSGLPSPEAKGQLAQVRGSGGIGKSLLAEEYALRFGAWWPGGIFWLRAYGNSDNPDEKPVDLAARRQAAYSTQMAAFATRLGIDPRKMDNAQISAAIGLHLKDPYLWIVDDLPACGREEQEHWLAPSKMGQTLITTRSRKRHGSGAEIDLGLLPPEDARALLTRNHPPKPEDIEPVNRILELLDGHALALDVASVACQRHGYAGFRHRLEHPDHDALALAGELAGELPNGHNPYIAVTLLSSVRQLDETGLDCLRLAALLAYAPIPAKLLADCLMEADSLETLQAEDQAALGVQQILNQSLAEESEDHQAYLVHILVSRTLRHHDPKPERQAALLASALTVLERQLQQAADITKHAHIEPVLVHAQALARDASRQESLDLAGRLGRYGFEQGHYQTARFWYEFEKEGLSVLLGEEHPNTLSSMNNLASTLWNLGDLDGARNLEETVLEARRRILGVEHPDTLTSMNNLAGTLWKMDEREEALNLMQAAADGRERVLGPEHLHTIGSRQAAEKMQATMTMKPAFK